MCSGFLTHCHAIINRQSVIYKASDYFGRKLRPDKQSKDFPALHDKKCSDQVMPRWPEHSADCPVANQKRRASPSDGSARLAWLAQPIDRQEQARGYLAPVETGGSPTELWRTAWARPRPPIPRAHLRLYALDCRFLSGSYVAARGILSEGDLSSSPPLRGRPEAVPCSSGAPAKR